MSKIICRSGFSIFIIACFVFAISVEKASVAAESTIITVDVPQLLYEYNTNALAMEMKYKGNEVKLIGVISSINRDKNGNPYIALLADTEQNKHPEKGPFQIKVFSYDKNIKCNFGEDQVDALIKLNSGEKVSVLCNKLSSLNYTILLSECKIVKP